MIRQRGINRVARVKLIPIVLEDMLYEWAVWEESVIANSCLGYPKQTLDSKLAKGEVGTGGGGGSRVPSFNVPRHLVAVDSVVRDMPCHLQMVLRNHYKDTKVPKHALTKAHHWLMGAMSQSCMSCEMDAIRLESDN